MGNEDEAVLLAKDSASHLGLGDITYPSLTRLFPITLMVDAILFLLLYLMGTENGYYTSILIVWIFVSAILGYLTALICIAGIEAVLNGKSDAPSVSRLFFFGAFTVVWFAMWLNTVAALFQGF